MARRVRDFHLAIANAIARTLRNRQGRHKDKPNQTVVWFHENEGVTGLRPAKNLISTVSKQRQIRLHGRILPLTIRRRPEIPAQAPRRRFDWPVLHGFAATASSSSRSSPPLARSISCTSGSRKYGEFMISVVTTADFRLPSMRPVAPRVLNTQRNTKFLSEFGRNPLFNCFAARF